MRHRIYCLIALPIAAALVGTAQANPAAIQTKTLTARPRVQTWRSTHFPSDQVVKADLYSDGKELAQEGYERCGAWYLNKGLSVRLDVVHCKSRSHDSQTWYVLRYSSVVGPRVLTVKLIPLN